MIEPAITSPVATIYLGDCLDVLADLPDASVDSIVTDPPYGLSNTDPAHVVEALTQWATGNRTFTPTGRGFMGKSWDAFVPPPAVWDECFRVLKPGGHLLSFAGSRTFDLMTLSIRFAGFDIRDSIAWLYGSGFPKSLDVSKAIDKAAGAERPRQAPQTRKRPSDAIVASGFGADGWAPQTKDAQTEDAQQWNGWGTALKPAFEPIVVARKPLIGTVAANVLAHGTGALNIDGTRVPSTDLEGVTWTRGGGSLHARGGPRGAQAVEGKANPHEQVAPNAGGRWPTNVVLDGDTADALDEQGPHTKDGVAVQRNGGGQALFGGIADGINTVGARPDHTFGGEGGPSRFFPTFRYQAKAPTRERPTVVAEDGTKTAHPTVKPLALMRWLVRLVTPPGGTVLEPFAGSGTTIEAAALEGFASIGIEGDASYIPLIQIRLDRLPSEGAPS